MSLPLVHHPGYTIELPPEHPFPMAKFRVLRRQLDVAAIRRVAQWLEPEPVTAATLSLVHEPAYINALFQGDLDAAAQRRSGFRWSPELVQRVRLETGGTLLTVEAALASGLAVNTAGGTHHAHPDFASGYCLINDIAVAAADAVRHGRAHRVLIIDLDVHQGDGTARMFADTPEVFTFSVHAARNFPARKATSDRDVGLPNDTDDDGYMTVLRQELPELLSQVQPDLVIYDAGVDVHKDDRLGHLALTDYGLRERDAYVIQEVRQGDIPLAAVIGGGYDRDLEALAARHAFLHHAAAEFLYCEEPLGSGSGRRR